MAESITIDKVSKEYYGGTRALSEVSIAVEPGTFLVLLGPSGSGKTTLLRCLAGIERITAGQIAIGDTTVAGGQVHVPPDRRNLSMVFQDYALWPHLRARENVAFALHRQRLPSSKVKARTMTMLDRVGLAALAERYPNELSGGEQQRVALARALVAGTGLILCDEPLSNLDADLRERMRVEISSLVREAGATTLYITHDQAEAFALADRVGVLERGRLVQSGTPEEIYANPASPFVARFTGLAGELTVRVVNASSNGWAEVEPVNSGGHSGTTARLRVRIPQCRIPRALSASETVMLVRPTGVELCAVGNGHHHLEGVVADVAFRGRGYEHAIDVPGHGRLTSVFGRNKAARGAAVGLRLDPEGCHVFPAG